MLVQVTAEWWEGAARIVNSLGPSPNARFEAVAGDSTGLRAELWVCGGDPFAFFLPLFRKERAHPHLSYVTALIQSDAELSCLALAAASGDSDAMTTLFEAVLPRARNLVRYLVRGDREVDDISQEAILLIFRGIGSYQGSGPFRAWADRITARCVFSRLKARSNEPTEDVDHIHVADVTSPHPDAYTYRRQIVAQLDQLPYDQRAALVLHHVLGMTLPEIASEVGVPEETVRSRLRLGKQRLRERLLERADRMVG